MKWQTVRFTVVIILIAALCSLFFVALIDGGARSRNIVVTLQADYRNDRATFRAEYTPPPD